jgi:puromycin-sensitive aminopeptidase
VKIDAQCKGSAASVALHQERFVTLGGTPPSSSPLWAVPVCFKTSGPGTQQCNLLERRDQTVSLPACSANLFGNANGRGYYFSEYPTERVLAIARTARSSLAPAERLTLLGDEWWMVRAGRHDIGAYFDSASALGSDEAPSVVEQIGRSLASAHDTVFQPSDAPRFEEWVRRRFASELVALGVPGGPSDSDDRQSRRATLLSLVGVTGNSQELQRQARDLALKYIGDATAVPPTLASTVLGVAAYGGDAMLYDLYMAQLPKLSGKPEEYYRFFNTLPSFRDPALVQRTLRFAISPDVRTQDTATLIAGLLGRTSSQDAAWAFVQENWDTLTNKLGVFQGIPRIAGAVGAFCTREKRSEVEQFFKDHPVPAAERTLRQAFERIDSCVAMKERQAAPASSWLATGSR